MNVVDAQLRIPVGQVHTSRAAMLHRPDPRGDQPEGKAQRKSVGRIVLLSLAWRLEIL